MSRDENGNVVLEEGFRQVCVWPGTLVNESDIPEFVKFFAEELGTSVQFMESVTTTPGMHQGQPVPDTGGRVDVLFAVRTDHIEKFAVPRLRLGISWIEDVYLNGGGGLYEARVGQYRYW